MSSAVGSQGGRMMVEKAGTSGSEGHYVEPIDSLEEFYQWAKKIGHYHATDAVERYRKMKDES